MSQHPLQFLRLLDRYEPLLDAIGPEVANVLVSPPDDSVDELRRLANEVLSRNEGILVPISGPTGVGKTTFIRNTQQWLPTLYGPTLTYEGKLVFEDLVDAVTEFKQALTADDKRIVSINIDHRESDLPTDAELATVQRFLRTNAAGIPIIVFWPQIKITAAKSIADRYIDLSGEVAVKLPLAYKGPDRSTWISIAKHTMSLANKMSNLEDLGVDPANYAPTEFESIGKFLRKIAHDFRMTVDGLRRQLNKRVSVIIAFASASTDPGVLSQLTSPSRYGLLDSHALIAVTGQSQIGVWWNKRRGLLTRAIVQLNATAICLPPTVSASCIRNFTTTMPLFDRIKFKRYGPARGVQALLNSDLGKILIRSEFSRFEARGTPAEGAAKAFAALGSKGFNLGADKGLNRVMETAINAMLDKSALSAESSTAEQKLPFCGLIPDNAFFYQDYVQCVEYTWRSAEYLDSKNRAAVATYILSKLRDYSRQLEWTPD